MNNKPVLNGIVLLKKFPRKMSRDFPLASTYASPCFLRNFHALQGFLQDTGLSASIHLHSHHETLLDQGIIQHSTTRCWKTRSVGAREFDILRDYLNPFIVAQWMRFTFSRCVHTYYYFFQQDIFFSPDNLYHPLSSQFKWPSSNVPGCDFVR